MIETARPGKIRNVAVVSTTMKELYGSEEMKLVPVVFKRPCKFADLESIPLKILPSSEPAMFNRRHWTKLDLRYCAMVRSSLTYLPDGRLWPEKGSSCEEVSGVCGIIAPFS